MAYTWSSFKEAVKSLVSDVSREDTTAVLAVSHFVKAYVALQVDKNAALAQIHSQQWELLKTNLLGYTIGLNAADLRTAVNALLTVDAARLGIYESGGFIDTLIAQARLAISGQAAWYDGQIRQAVIDLQHHIDYYKKAHETTFTFADVVQNGEACDVIMPEGAMVRDIYYVQDDADCKRMPIVQYDWQNRFDLTCGAVEFDGRKFYAAIDPNGQKFTVYPSLEDGYHLSVFYDSLKIDFIDGDSVPFDEGAVLAVADFIRSRMYIQPPRLDARLSATARADYAQKRLQLFSDAKDKQTIRYLNDSVAGNCACALCSSSESDDDEDTDAPSSGCRSTTVYTVDKVNGTGGLKELPSNECRVLVFVMHPETGFHRAYSYRHGDATADTGEPPFTEPDMVIPDDNLGRYHAFSLS
jgi:hypothetical protein